jgi:hypothetical protein
MDRVRGLCEPGLGDMPAEMIAYIVNFVEPFKDLAACAVASPLLSIAASECIASRARDCAIKALLSAGAPQPIVCTAAEHQSHTVAQDWIVPAARGGCVQTLAWVCTKATLLESYFYYCTHGQSKDADDCANCTLALARHLRNPQPETTQNKRARREPSTIVGLGVVALYEALDRGRWEALDFLLHDSRLRAHRILHCAGIEPQRRLRDSLCVKAVSDPACSIDIIWRLHRLGTSPSGCHCHPSVLTAAVESDRADVLALFHDIQCNSVTVGNRPWSIYANDDVPLLAMAIAHGSVKIAKWMIDMRRNNDSHQNLPCVDAAIRTAVVSAAQKGHVATLALVHTLWPRFDFGDALVAAAASGHIDVLEWACDGARTVRGHPSRRIGYAAATNRRTDTVKWLAQRVDARLYLGIGAARAVVGANLSPSHPDPWLCAGIIDPTSISPKGRSVEIALILHETGIAPFDCWDSLDVAVGSGSIDMVALVAENHALYTLETMICAVRSGSSDIVAYVCGRYGTEHVQAALDAISGTHFDVRAIGWLCANVPGICVAGLYACSPRDLPPCPCLACAAAAPVDDIDPVEVDLDEVDQDCCPVDDLQRQSWGDK